MSIKITANGIEASGNLILKATTGEVQMKDSTPGNVEKNTMVKNETLHVHTDEHSLNVGQVSFGEGGQACIYGKGRIKII